MTEKDIIKTINKHSIKAVIAVVLVTLIAEVLDTYFFSRRSAFANMDYIACYWGMFICFPKSVGRSLT